MKLTLYTWSGIGDSLMALPLIYALKSLGHEVILPSNQQALPFYEFLRDQEIISGIASYRHRSVVDWIRAFGNTDKLILPAGVERWQHPLLWALRKGAPAFGPFLRLGLRIKELETIEDVHEKSPSPKLPLASNRAQSYIHWIERYGLDFKLDWLFFEDRVLLKCRERIQKLLIGKGLEPGEYAILYPATIRAEKNMPEPLVNQIAEYCFERHPLRIGLSMDATIDTHDRSGAALSTLPENKAIASTDMYAQNLKAADARVAQIVADNLARK